MPGAIALRLAPGDPLEGEPLEDSRLAYHALRRILADILEPFDLVVADYKALRLVGRGSARASAVSLHAEISPSATTELLDRLETRGLIARSSDPSDRRATLISLTKRGEKLQREAALAYRQCLDDITRQMSREGLAALQKGSKELRAILERKLETTSGTSP